MKKFKKIILAATILFVVTSFKNAETPVFTGKFDINAETHSMELFLVQNAQKVIGTYDIPLGSGNMGYIIGDVNNNRLDFELHEVFYGESKESSNGKGFLILSKDGNSVSGDVTSYYEGESQIAKWTGTRIE